VANTESVYVHMYCGGLSLLVQQYCCSVCSCHVMDVSPLAAQRPRVSTAERQAQCVAMPVRQLCRSRVAAAVDVPRMKGAGCQGVLWQSSPFQPQLPGLLAGHRPASAAGMHTARCVWHTVGVYFSAARLLTILFLSHGVYMCGVDQVLCCICVGRAWVQAAVGLKAPGRTKLVLLYTRLWAISSEHTVRWLL
jgi:hypothetical protein